MRGTDLIRAAADLLVLREALGLSRRQLADLYGVEERSVGRWEHGARSIPEGVWTIIDDLDERARALVQLATRGAKEMEASVGEAADAFVVRVYATDRDLWAAQPEFEPLPASYHRAIVARLRSTFPDVRFTFDDVT